jgi:hypothetical protein
MIRRRNKTLRAGSSLIPDLGAIGRLFSPSRPGIGPMKKGELTRYGYKSSAPRTVRRNALRKAVQTYGATSTFRKVNALETLTKNTAPSRSKTYRADRNWVRKTFM